MNPQPKNKPIRLKGKAYSDLRYAVWLRDGGRCQMCCAYVRLNLPNGGYDVFSCAHLAHIKSRGSGGADTMENTRILCPECHLNRDHGTRFGEV